MIARTLYSRDPDNSEEDSRVQKDSSGSGSGSGSDEDSDAASDEDSSGDTMQSRFSEDAVIEETLSVGDLVFSCLKTCDVTCTLSTLKRVSQAWSRAARATISVRRKLGCDKLASLADEPWTPTRGDVESLTANWLHSEKGAGWTAEDVASWLYSDEGVDWPADEAGNWLCSKEGAGWEAERVASWLNSNEGADWQAKHVANWLCSEAEVDEVADWLYSSDTAVREPTGRPNVWRAGSAARKALAWRP